MKKLLGIVAKLRSKEGCPWDRKQTHTSLLPFLLEETWEVIETIYDKEKQSDLSEELGDLLLQIALHAQIAEEEGRFTYQDIENAICEKMLRRHPHVFADNKEDFKQADLHKLWEVIKKREKKEASIFSSIPLSAPSLFVAFKLGQKAQTQGFDWKKPQDSFDKVKEEVIELEEVLQSDEINKKELEHEIGDLLFSVCNIARKYDIMPEIALHKCNQRFIQRYKGIETAVVQADKEGKKLSLEQMEDLWQKAKMQEM